MSTTATEQVTVKNLERDINIGLSVHKGSPPNHIEGSPRSIGSSSSNTSGGSVNTNTYPAVKYYNTPLDKSSTIGGVDPGGFGTTVPIPIPSQMQATIMAHTDTNTSSSIGDISELLTATATNTQLIPNRPFVFTPSSMGDDNNGTYINWLYDLYAPAVGTSQMAAGHKIDKMRSPVGGGGGGPLHVGTPPNPQPISVSPEIGSMMAKSDQNSPPSSLLSTSGPPPDMKMFFSQDVDFPKEPTTVFRAQEKYLVILGAPTSIAQRHGEDTLTYLNKGQFYNLYFRANSALSLPENAKSVIHLSFLDEPDRRVEFNHWQYWYDLQANPNQKAFDIDRKNCEGLTEKPFDLSYNGSSFIWNPEIGAKIVLRINCLSTEFSSQKGVKGLPIHIVTDTYEDIDGDSEPAHRGYCKVKIFRDKGAERKNKDETKTVERRLQKFVRSQQGVSLDTEIGPSAVFHPPCKETILTPTSTFGAKPSLFNPKPGDRESSKGVAIPLPNTSQDPSPLSSCSPSGVSPTPLAMFSNKATFLANIRDREMKRTFTKTLTQTKEDLDQLEVGPKYKSMKVPSTPVTTIYVRKEEEKIYNALLLNIPTVDGLKTQISKKYDIPEEMIRYVYKKTKKGLIVRFDDDMVARFNDEDDFIIEIEFDNQKGHFDLFVRY